MDRRILCWTIALLAMPDSTYLDGRKLEEINIPASNVAGTSTGNQSKGTIMEKKKEELPFVVRSNNPVALRGMENDKWIGQTSLGTDLVTFDTLIHGARGAIRNFLNAIKDRPDYTVEQHIRRYVPKKENPPEKIEGYIKYFEQYGYPRTMRMKLADPMTLASLHAGAEGWPLQTLPIPWKEGLQLLIDEGYEPALNYAGIIPVKSPAKKGSTAYVK